MLKVHDRYSLGYVYASVFCHGDKLTKARSIVDDLTKCSLDLDNIVSRLEDF